MRYVVTDRFYNMLGALYATAVEDGNKVEIDLALGLLMDTVQGQDEL